MRNRKILAAAALTAACVAALAACSQSEPDTSVAPTTGATTPPGGPTVSQADFDKAMSTPTDLTFWTWVPDIQNQVDLFEAKYPAITVHVENVGGAAEHYQKLRTAIKAGTGAPDVAQVEYQYLSSFRIGGDLLDLAPYVGDMSATYPEWVWSQVSTDNGVWGIPQDAGPMGNLYREDLLEQAGIEAPATWDDFAAAAATYHAANPDSYLTNLAPGDPGAFIGLLWQAGARPFSYDGEQTVTINLHSEEVTKVTSYWQNLIQSGLVSVDPDFTDQWYQGLASGKYASWQTAAWGPLFLQGTAGDTSGLWRASELPQWQAGTSAAGNWGGSTDAVLATTKNPIAAAELARFINVEHEPALKFATEQFLFPVTNEVLADPTFTDQKSDFYGGQQVNQLFAQISTTVNPDFGWLPFMDFAYSSYNETVGKAVADKGDMVAAMAVWESQLIEYAKSQGFTVN
jgi:multiple sugar transport system substrate-binding protein